MKTFITMSTEAKNLLYNITIISIWQDNFIEEKTSIFINENHFLKMYIIYKYADTPSNSFPSSGEEEY